MDGVLCCEICGQQDGMETEADIRTHMLLEHDEQGPTCPLCDLSELTIEELQLHMNTAHVDILSPANACKKSQSNFTSNRPSSANGRIGQHSTTQNSELKMAAIFSEGTANGIDNDCQKNSTHKQSAWNPQEIELSDIKIEHAKDSNYPLQLRAPLSDQQSSDINQPSAINGLNTKNNSANSVHESLQMKSIGHDGSMLLFDSDEDDISMPGSSTDSPCRKRPRNVTNSSMSDCSSITDEHRGERTSKGPIKRLLQSLTPKKSSETSSNLNSSGIWFDQDPTVPDLSLQEGQRSLEDEPECPFCDLRGLDPDTMREHVETAHSNLLGQNENQQNQTNQKEPKPTLLSLSQSAKKVESAILCPICGLGSYDPDFITAHIDTEHPEMGTSNQSEVENGQVNGAEASPGTSEGACPMCGLKGLNERELTAHVEGHFEDTAHTSRGVCKGDDNQLAWQLAEDQLREDEKQRQKRIEDEEFKKLQLAENQLLEEEKQRQKRREEEEFKKLQAEYGMDGSSGFQHQSETALEKEVAKGKISLTDYHQQKGRIRQIVATGMDDGISRTQGLINKFQEFYSADNRNISSARLCSDMDHFSATAGDRGWGCGYRNVQMLLSGMLRDPVYKNVVFNGRDAIPSIGKLQQLIEAAWEQGWDPQGREQLGGKVCNTRTWIGATEVVSMLSYLRTKYILVDFHKPSGPNGTHPRMFEWVKDYFGQPGGIRLFNRGNQIISNKMPLYFQHQGHSRTIVGYETLKDNSIRLLIFDPSVPRQDMETFKEKDADAKSMRTFRKSLAQMKAKQYQIVGVQGVYNNDREHEESKLIRSQRIP